MEQFFRKVGRVTAIQQEREQEWRERHLRARHWQEQRTSSPEDRRDERRPGQDPRMSLPFLEAVWLHTPRLAAARIIDRKSVV